MPFQKNHAYRWKPENEVSLESTPICFKGRVGQRDALKEVPGWQDKLRDYVDELINKKPS